MAFFTKLFERVENPVPGVALALSAAPAAADTSTFDFDTGV